MNAPKMNVHFSEMLLLMLSMNKFNSLQSYTVYKSNLQRSTNFLIVSSLQIYRSKPSVFYVIFSGMNKEQEDLNYSCS